MNDPSLWLDRPRPASSPPLPDGSRFDAVVVGAGLTGLCTALELSRAGAAVAVLEGRRAGSVTTGRTTGKISLLQGTKLSQIAERYPTDVVRAYVEATRDGRRRLLGLCRSFEVPVQVETAYTYATSSEGATALAAEFDAATEAGLDVRWDEAAELPFPVTGAIGLADQAQFDPVDLVTALVRELRGRGVPVVENTRVRSVGRTPGGLAVRHDGRGELVADRVVLATGTPVLDRGSFFARLEPQRSYCIAVAGTDQRPRGMYLSADSPTRSLRYAPTPDGDLLIVGGNGHTVGRGGATQPRVADDSARPRLRRARAGSNPGFRFLEPCARSTGGPTGCRQCVPISGASSGGTTANAAGTVRCTAPASPRTAGSSKGPPRGV